MRFQPIHQARIPSLAISCLLLCASLQAKTFTVTSFSDGYGANTLRGAIIAANRSGGNNTIILSGGHYRLTIPGTDEDNSKSGDLDIYGKLTITTRNNARATIDAHNIEDRVFQIQTNAKVSFENLTITGGTSPTGGSGESGGGIFNAGSLTLKNCFVTGNAGGRGNMSAFPSAIGFGGNGGGIFNVGTVTMDTCTISNNSSGSGSDFSSGGGAIIITTVGEKSVGNDPNAFSICVGGNGGGICNFGTMTLTKCLISANANGKGGDGAFPGASGGNGGGIFNAARLTLNSCAISNNFAGTGGKGFSYSGSLPTPGAAGGLGGSGGGVCNLGLLALNNSRLTGNSAGIGGPGGNFGGAGGPGGVGGGIYNNASNTLTITSCLITNNAAGNGSPGQDANVFSPTAPGGNGGTGGSGGGIFNESGSQSPLLSQTLVALNLAGNGATGGAGGTSLENSDTGPTGNTGIDGTGPDLAGQFATHGHNLIRIGDGSTGIINSVNNDTVGTAADPAF